jgi:hypothetical protein
MSYDPRSIAFCAEIIYPPQHLRADLVQSIHNTLYQQPQIGYLNFQVAPDGIHLANLPQAPGQVSLVTFVADRMIIREELRGTSVEDFATRVVNLVTTSFRTLGVTASLAQQFVVRALISPRRFRDGLEFLKQRVIASQSAESEAFGRPLQALGARFVFPPSESHTEAYHVRIESWPQDPRSVWIENTGSYSTPIPAGDEPRLANHIYSTYRFLTGPVSDFLAGLDNK